MKSYTEFSTKTKKNSFTGSTRGTRKPEAVLKGYVIIEEEVLCFQHTLRKRSEEENGLKKNKTINFKIKVRKKNYNESKLQRAN